MGGELGFLGPRGWSGSTLSWAAPALAPGDPAEQWRPEPSSAPRGRRVLAGISIRAQPRSRAMGDMYVNYRIYYRESAYSITGTD